MSSSTNINLLPQEMITQIFTRLPAKSLGLCKCVSKSWDSLISDHSFVKAHLAKTSITKLILFSASWPWGDLFSVDYGNNYNNHPNLDGFASNSSFKTSVYLKNVWIKALGSCNGLLLLENNRGIRFLINPTTHKFKKLRGCHGGYVNDIFGLGYDSSSDDYVVVAIYYSLSREEDANVFVYKLKENVWMKIGCSPYDHTSITPSPGIFLGGYLHWFAKDPNNHALLVISFDIANKKFSTVPLPSGVLSNLNVKVVRIRVLKGCLCLVNGCNSKTELWVMKEYGVVESWVKLPVALAEGTTVVSTQLAEDSLVIKGGQFVLLASNEKEVTLQPIRVLGLPFRFCVGMAYVDSLVSPAEGLEDEEHTKEIEQNTEAELGW